MRLLPDSPLARLVLVFLGGMTLTSVVILWAQMPEREALAFRISAGRAAHRLADYVKLADQLPAANRDRLAEVASTRGVRMRLLSGPSHSAVPEPGSDAAVFRDILRETLARDWPLTVSAGPAEDIPPEPGQTQPQDGFDFAVEARLSDGSWVALGMQDPRRIAHWPKRTIANLLIVMGVLAVLSFVVVRWVTRPLYRLADAAETLGRNINRPALPETGPREVRRAARAFNVMQERLSRYIRNRTGILTALSHDLKTPITRLRLRAEMLEQPEVRDKFVRDLAELEHMVHSTLSFMRGLDDREPLRSIDVMALTAALQADAEELGRNVQVLGKPLEPFFGKPEGLKRCLQNLLDNALRYGRDVELVIEDDAQVLTLYVRDRGPGIPQQDLERVFEPFYRLEASRNPSTGGSGLGLSIARNLAQSMGGGVMLRNRAGGGLEAKLTLPRIKPPPVVASGAQPRVEPWSASAPNGRRT